MLECPYVCKAVLHTDNVREIAMDVKLAEGHGWWGLEKRHVFRIPARICREVACCNECSIVIVCAGIVCVCCTVRKDGRRGRRGDSTDGRGRRNSHWRASIGRLQQALNRHCGTYVPSIGTDGIRRRKRAIGRDIGFG